jgi:ATP-dependent Clp protease ATP-binding subunit ClpA
LLAEPDGLAARAIVALGVALEAVKSKVEEIAPSTRAAQSVPDRVPFAPRTKKVLELSVREALRLLHNYIGTEHLLLGVLEEGDGLGSQALVSLGITHAAVTEWLVKTFAEMQLKRASTGGPRQDEGDADST